MINVTKLTRQEQLCGARIVRSFGSLHDPLFTLSLADFPPGLTCSSMPCVDDHGIVVFLIHTLQYCRRIPTRSPRANQAKSVAFNVSDLFGPIWQGVRPGRWEGHQITRIERWLDNLCHPPLEFNSRHGKQCVKYPWPPRRRSGLNSCPKRVIIREGRLLALSMAAFGHLSSQILCFALPPPSTHPFRSGGPLCSRRCWSLCRLRSCYGLVRLPVGVVGMKLRVMA